MLQNNPMVASIRKAVTNRVLSELKALAEKEPDAYAKLWADFGAVLKEGLYEDRERRDALYELARFHSTAGGEKVRSLKEYVAALRENQTAIYYLVGDSLDKLKASPQLEGFRARGVEVLLLTDPVDNFWVTAALGFDGKPFKSITQGDANIDAVPLAEGAAAPAAATGATAQLIEAMKRVLGGAVSDIKASSRLVDSPACLVAAAGGPDRGLEKIMSRQADRGPISAPVAGPFNMPIRTIRTSTIPPSWLWPWTALPSTFPARAIPTTNRPWTAAGNGSRACRARMAVGGRLTPTIPIIISIRSPSPTTGRCSIRRPPT